MLPASMTTGYQGRLLAVLLLLVVLGGIYLVVALPILDLYAGRAAVLENRRMLVPRLKAAAEELPGLRARVAELRATAGARKVTLEGSSDAIASANLQSRLEELATAAGVAISSTEGLPAEARGLYRRIGLRIAISGAYESIVKLLAAIETSTPPLVLDNLQIHGTLQARALLQPQAALRSQMAQQPAGPPVNPRLDAGFEVYGFRSNETPVVLKQ